MKRDFKFRLWDAQQKMMTAFDFESIWQKRIGQGYCDTMISQSCLFSPSAGHNPDLYIMQFTGINDKKGKEICEGDVYTCTRFINQKLKHFKGVITFRYGRFIILGFGDHPIGIDISTDGEVLGNIYENPELLNHARTHH